MPPDVLPTSSTPATDNRFQERLQLLVYLVAGDLQADAVQRFQFLCLLHQRADGLLYLLFCPHLGCNVQHDEQHQGLFVDIQAARREEEGQLLFFPVDGERQACPHLLVALARLEGVQHRAADGAVLAGRPIAAALGAIEGVQAAQRLAAAQAVHFGGLAVGKVGGE